MIFDFLVDDVEGFEELGIHLRGQEPWIGSRGGIDGAHVYLVLAVLHVYHGDVLAVEQLGVAPAVVAYWGRFLEQVLVFTGARQDAAVAAAGGELGIFLQKGLEVDAEVYVLFHVFSF